VVPAAFAMAAVRPTSGKQLLRAVAAGYDIGTRMTMALGVSTFDLRGSNPNSHAYVPLTELTWWCRGAFPRSTDSDVGSV
jgi:hypothetical protein